MRTCECCGEGMREGYLAYGSFPYCSGACFVADEPGHPAEWERCMTEWETLGDCDDLFWTEWEGGL